MGIVKLAEEINFGVNHLIKVTPGVTFKKSPASTLTDKSGTSGDAAVLKLSLLQSRGIPTADLFVGVSVSQAKAVAMVRDFYRPWWATKKRPCLLVLLPDVHRVYRLDSAKCTRKLRPIFITSYGRIKLELEQEVGGQR